MAISEKRDPVRRKSISTITPFSARNVVFAAEMNLSICCRNRHPEAGVNSLLMLLL
jgi:hypothetical protein